MVVKIHLFRFALKNHLYQKQKRKENCLLFLARKNIHNYRNHPETRVWASADKNHLQSFITTSAHLGREK